MNIRKLLRKIESAYYIPNSLNIYMKDEAREISKLINIGYLHQRSGTDRDIFVYYLNKSCQQDISFYPLTEKGYEYLYKNWYMRLRESLISSILIDLAGIIGFLIAIISIFVS